MNILKEANQIVNDRSEEKERQYGSFSQGMERAAQILGSMRGRHFDAHDMFAAMIALKMSRQSFNFKTDNLLDAVAYMGAWENYIQELEKNTPKKAPVPVDEDTTEFENGTFKKKLEEEVFPVPTDTFMQTIEKIKSHLETLSIAAVQNDDKINTLTKYVTYLAENLDNVITELEKKKPKSGTRSTGPR